MDYEDLGYKAPTVDEWLGKVRVYKNDLVFLLENYHPNNRQPGRRKNQDFITAPGAEAACTVIRKQIKDKNEGDPIERFNKAFNEHDVTTILALLNEAWFGVPESVTAWGIKGFREAVELIEEPPDDGKTHPRP